MSRLRPETQDSTNPVTLDNGSAYYAVYQAVRRQPGLIHGRLHNSHGEPCALGSLWTGAPRVTLYTRLIDEIAAVNDSVQSASPRQRKQVVERWLRWKCQQAGIPLPGRRIAKEPRP